jgi:hypothetical protein
MNARSLALAVFVVLTVAFASTTAFEYSSKSSSKMNETVTSISTVTSLGITSTTCYNPLPQGHGYGCISGYNFTISVEYAGPWLVTYQGYNSLGKSNATTTLGTYQGSGPMSRTIVVPGLNQWTLCAETEKLDSSNATLVLKVGGENSTSAPYGWTSFCDEAQTV